MTRCLMTSVSRWTRWTGASIECEILSVTDLMSDVCVVMELVGNNVLRKWLSIISLKAASDEAEDTVRDLHSKTVYGSASQQVRSGLGHYCY